MLRILGLRKEKVIYNQRNKTCFRYFVSDSVIKEMIHDLTCSIELKVFLRTESGGLEKDLELFLVIPSSNFYAFFRSPNFLRLYP